MRTMSAINIVRRKHEVIYESAHNSVQCAHVREERLLCPAETTMLDDRLVILHVSIAQMLTIGHAHNVSRQQNNSVC